MIIDGYVAEILNNQIMKDINAKKATDKEFADYLHAHSVPINLVNNAVVKALEDIRKEIKERSFTFFAGQTTLFAVSLEDVLEIIDRKVNEVTNE